MRVFNVMINDITTIRYSAPSVYAIYDDLDLLEHKFMKFRKQILSKAKRVDMKRDIELDNISYNYPDSDESAVKNIIITITKGTGVAFVGGSGGGETALVDIIVVLLTPHTGRIRGDGKDIYDNIRCCMKNIGYHQQSSYLFDERIFRSIAVGIPDNEVDEDKLDSA